MIQIHVLFAQKVSGGEKLIEKFLKELSIKQPIPDSIIKQYIVSDGTDSSINKIQNSLVLVRTAYLNNADKPTGFKVEELTIGTTEAGTRYYGIRLDSEHSLNFVVWKDKIKSISSYTDSSYNTTIFF
ncbi:hypothetical protein [Sphingobacterium detergens]|uniref:Uncharacterized protein n=1 Tax=Sphingobacterium detergens TaxID=1145106 RepID=A0A420B6Z5_SPHD1|nr:hypothetical protein [Sphingobacterium detergens]RKE52461.1 hypothetical protein DFQ12_2698 [Sphingobacterium detergens]